MLGNIRTKVNCCALQAVYIVLCMIETLGLLLVSVLTCMELMERRGWQPCNAFRQVQGRTSRLFLMTGVRRLGLSELVWVLLAHSFDNSLQAPLTPGVEYVYAAGLSSTLLALGMGRLNTRWVMHFTAVSGPTSSKLPIWTFHRSKVCPVVGDVMLISQGLVLLGQFSSFFLLLPSLCPS